MKKNLNPYDIYQKHIEAANKEELARELGIKIPEDGYWGDMPSRVCGLVGGAIGGKKVKEAIEDYENNLVKKQ